MAKVQWKLDPVWSDTSAADLRKAGVDPREAITSMTPTANEFLKLSRMNSTRKSSARRTRTPSR